MRAAAARLAAGCGPRGASRPALVARAARWLTGRGVLRPPPGGDPRLDRALLGGTWLAMAGGTVLLGVRAAARDEPAVPTMAVGALLLASLTWAQYTRAPQRALALALLAGAALAALTVLNPPYDPMVLGQYCLALMLAALVLGAREMAAITLHYFVYYALFNVLVAPPSQAGFHWEALLATLLVFSGIALGAWTLAAGQRWLRASRRAVEAANAQLAAALEREQRFLADVAHQLRTPLAIARTSIALLHAQDAPDLATVRQTLREVEREAERLSRTVDDLLALSRAEAKAPIAREPVDLLELVQTVYSQGRRLPGGERLQLDLGPEPERWDWLVLGDERLLQQLVLNLVDNALKYSPADAPVRLTLAATPERLTLTVRDWGPGIPAEEREQVFERYYRGTTARGVRGSGLGLCIARWIATAHGGTLTVESSPGQGSTFTLSLPPWQPPNTDFSPPG